MELYDFKIETKTTAAYRTTAHTRRGQ